MISLSSVGANSNQAWNNHIISIRINDNGNNEDDVQMITIRNI